MLVLCSCVSPMVFAYLWFCVLTLKHADAGAFMCLFGMQGFTRIVAVVTLSADASVAHIILVHGFDRCILGVSVCIAHLMSD